MHTKRTWLIGPLGALLAALLCVMTVGAQSTPTATPTAGTGSTTTAPSGQPGAVSGEQVTAAIQAATTTIAAVQKDVAAVNGKVDASTTNTLLGKVGGLRDQAQSALTAGNLTKGQGFARAATQAATAAEGLLRADLSAHGLPSQQAAASRDLVSAYYGIQELTNQAKTNGSVDVSAYVSLAQNLYKQAYDLYGKGTYAQASQTAHVAVQVGQIANAIYAANGIPSGTGAARPAPALRALGGPGGHGPGPMGVGGPAAGSFSTEQPLTVPAPNF